MLFENEPLRLPLKETEILLYPNFFDTEKAHILFQKLLTETPWQADTIKVYGKEYPQPRLTALYGNNGKSYSYSNIVMQPHPMNALITFIKDEVELQTQLNFTTVLLNLYRNEKDSNGWHADNEKELGRNPFIASVSFGETRKFQIKHNTDTSDKITVDLTHGSLLLMKENSQTHYKHQIPKSTAPKKERINLTFRKIV